MMMNTYYSSNRNNIDDTNKLFYKVVIFPILSFKESVKQRLVLWKDKIGKMLSQTN